MIKTHHKLKKKKKNLASFARRNQKTSPATSVLEYPAPPTPADVGHFRLANRTRGQKFFSHQLNTRRRQSNQTDGCMFLSCGGWKRRRGEGRGGSSEFYSSFFLKQTGRMESTARTPSTAREFQDTASPAVVSLYRVVPALIATNDGGATPVKGTGGTAGELATPATTKQGVRKEEAAQSYRGRCR